MIGFIIAFVGLGICCLVATIKIIRKERKKKRSGKELIVVHRGHEVSGVEKRKRRPLSRYEIERRLKRANLRTRNIKISPKHFPNSPAFEKQNWDRTKDPEEEKT